MLNKCKMKLFWKLFLLLAVIEFCSCKILRKRKRISTKKSTEYSNDIIIKLMIHYDKFVIKNLPPVYRNDPKRRLKTISKRIVLEAENIFKNFSSNQHNIKIQLIDSVHLANDRVPVAKDDNVSKYLHKYCRWQSKNKKGRLKFFSVLYTGLDVYYKDAYGQKHIKSTGRGYGAGVCSISHSCTVIEWHPKNAGFLLAHEVGHSLGIGHDGPPYNNCNPAGHVMSTKYNKTKPPVKWSECSRQAFTDFLQSDRAGCLRSKH